MGVKQISISDECNWVEIGSRSSLDQFFLHSQWHKKILRGDGKRRPQRIC